MDENPYQSPGDLERMPPKRRVLLWGSVLSVTHAIAFYQLFCSLSAVAAARQTAGEAPEQWQATVSNVLYVLSLPLLYVMPYVPGYLLDPLAIVNSSVWGFGLAWLLSKVLTRRYA